ncbi:hypothetical protein [Mesorhizobium sp.]|uniref:hypothetical protein n=1 Tax=Mesorhizobium sp. TaxID=1871066 RepID=UPI000FE49DFE|nr:hypothetical protein [Mesorhizobium sp.]RWI91312.1 MAG: hypothetical protein EOR21_20800 [Mesorhizobium sp.]
MTSFYGHDNGTKARSVACAEAANFLQILDELERIGFRYCFNSNLIHCINFEIAIYAAVSKEKFWKGRASALGFQEARRAALWLTLHLPWRQIDGLWGVGLPIFAAGRALAFSALSIP